MINSQLEAYIQNISSTQDIQLLSKLRLFLSRGGKRLRSKLFSLVYEAYKGKEDDSIVAVAASLEILHAFLLIHDDIIDNDLERWGGPTVAGVYYEQYTKTMEPAKALHAAQSQALLAGDLCLLLAQEQIDSSSFSAVIKLELQQQLRTTIKQTIAGESADVSQSVATKPPTEAEILSMYHNKTAEYSFALPLIFAAICSGRQDEIPKLQVLADNLGVAYQLQNDLQSTTSDEREHKRTLRALKGDDYAKQVAITYKEQAIAAVETLDISAENKKQFVAFIQQALSNL